MTYKWLDQWQRPGTILKALFFISLIGIIAIPAWVHKMRNHPVNWYQTNWCQENKGQIDASMPDKTGCGCLTDKNVVEFAYADHWYNTIGKCLYNSMQTGKKAGIVLILESEADKKYWLRLKNTIEEFNLPIEIWKYE